MNTNLKRWFSLSVLASCLIAGPAFAYDNNNNKDHKVQHAVPPAKYPGGENALSFFINAAYTYWVPYPEGVNLLYSNPIAVDGPAGQMHAPVINGASGFKVGLGANIHHDGWKTALNYTWFYYSPGMKALTMDTAVFTYTPTFNANTVTYSEFESRFSAQFNRIDAVLDRSCYMGHYLSFRPWLGLLGAWDKQYLEYNSTLSGQQEGTFDNARMKQNWWGIGPYAGGEATYYFTSDWGLFISSGAALLLANHQVYNNNINNDAEGDPASSFGLNNNSFNNVEPMLEAALGLRWDSNWTDWALRVDLGWELQTYFSHTGFLPFYSPVGVMGAYSMQGLTLGLRVNF